MKYAYSFVVLWSRLIIIINLVVSDDLFTPL